jgi:hypothetical protein
VCWGTFQTIRPGGQSERIIAWAEDNPAVSEDNPAV